MKTSQKILNLLKTQGALTAKVLAEELSLTTMGVRQHLLSLEESDDVTTFDKSAGRGRPTRYWKLTDKSVERFEDRHEDLSLQLIDSIKVVFGDSGLDKLIDEREARSFEVYQQAMSLAVGIEQKLNILADIRSQEGYMASIEQDNDVWSLYENHCPICAAATKCQSFCRSELQLFQQLFEACATVSREEHIVEGARRCAYKFYAK
ncbi:transcriptional regulator [Parashewanella curva]|uniref:Transcriptional regulator n=1 Tax=Parashewanella curva TaxID=2338552 RepID=A0A3L8Q1V5_9GAMM|nr:metalloregulator ArsR/SmtB family transcription factor [Parashewanella curva]RLV61667.1 transcriptional regulator [Parashewanella curva]